VYVCACVYMRAHVVSAYSCACVRVCARVCVRAEICAT
jgi:hypothetical protein